MSGKSAAEIAQLREWMNWYADRLQEEAAKHTRTKEELKEVRREMEKLSEENAALKIGIEHWKSLYESAKGRSLSWK